MQCTNNMKQLALAMHNYHDSYKSFPAGRGGPHCSYGSADCLVTTDLDTTHNCLWSGIFYIMPYTEHADLYDTYQAWCTTHGGKIPPSWKCTHTANSNIRIKPIEFLRCPSDSNVAIPTDKGVEKTSYTLCRGDTSYSNNQAAGLMQGMFTVLQRHDTAACVDGTSNTAMISEMVTMLSATEVTNASLRAPVKGGIALSLAKNTYSDDPSSCLNYKYASDTAYLNGSQFNTFRGQTRFCGRLNDMGGFVTILPPNSPSCMNGNNYYGDGIYSPQSNHSGGVNVALCDGSIRFVSDTIDCGTLSTATPGRGSTPSTGPSPYGIWGALGTREGGELKAF
ncbi:MAG: DUF1559 domain-containing protein [Planctomycetia bacterium]|nr:DUF1559 domain-containing protein [Planctomycetia bacterium]